jgi:hypothetical protein
MFVGGNIYSEKAALGTWNNIQPTSDSASLKDCQPQNITNCNCNFMLFSFSHYADQ